VTRWLRIVIGLVGLTGCSNDAPPGAVPDGSVPDVHVRDAAPDVAAPDDASDSAEPPFGCNPPPPDTILCTQFEDGGTPGAGWTSENVDYGTNAFDTTTYTSPVGSYVATAPDAGGLISSAILTLTAPNAGSYKTISARVMIRVHQVGERANVLQLSYPTGTNIQDVALVEIDASSLYMTTIASDFPVRYNVGPVAIDTWTEIRLDLTPPPATPDVSMYVGGTLVKSASPPFRPPIATERDADIGVTAPGKAINIVQFDDFLLRGLN